MNPGTPLPPLSLYIHIPWCVAKCPYCDFHSLPRSGPLPEKAYVAALLRDLDRSHGALGDRPIASVFFGGGTPSLFSGEAVHAILDGVSRRTRVAPDCEISLEANPGTLERERFVAFREAGVTRLSLGVQSLHDPFLKSLGRIHDARAAQDAMETAAGCGFRAFNIDLMYGLPGQKAADAAADVQKALAVHPPHLSLYELTIEAHTAFAHSPPPLPDEAEREAIEETVQGIAQDGGLERYEVSAYARGGYRCRHNLNYWEFGDYLGLGAGAHSKLTDEQGIRREVRVPDPHRYLIDKIPILSERRLSGPDTLFEFLLNGLRLTHGFSRQLLRERTGHDVESLGGALERAVRDGLLIVETDRVAATSRGRQFLDSLLTSLLAHVEGRRSRRSEAC